MAVLGPCVNVNMNGQSNIHSQLTKSLERILEDAYLSGELKLSGRKLREFPKPVKFDLSDTVVADLSKNRFCEVPDELTTYIFLEKLLLSQNILRNLPNAVGELQSLTFLDLRFWYHNQVKVVRWSNAYSEAYRMECGVRQGGVTSPKLFNLYVNELIVELSSAYVGCRIDDVCLNNISYANDMVLLSASPCGLTKLMQVCESSNQLTELPREICQMPLQVLLVPDNLLTTLPKEIGKMTTLAELVASNNRLTQVPMTLGDCAGMRALDLSNNQLGLLPLQVTYLRLEHLDVSCNCISSLPLELRNMNTLITLNLDNNPLVSPPTTVCMRGRVHIFKYLENMANKDNPAHRRVEETRRNAKHTSYLNSPPNNQIMSGNATIDCLRHKPRHVVDSGYSTDGIDKRWSNDGGGDTGGGSGRSTPSTPSTLSPGAALSRAQSLSSESPLPQLTPLLTGLRISPEGNISNGDDKSKLAHQQTYRQYKEALRQQRQQDIYRPRTEQSSPDLDPAPSPHHSPLHDLNGHSHSNVSPSLYRSSSMSPNSSQVPNSPLLHSTPRRFQNQNGNAEKEENKRPVQKVVPSRNVNKIYSAVNGNVEYGRANGHDTYTKPTSPTKSPTNTLGYNSIGTKSNIPRQAVNGDVKLLTTTVSYLKGAAPKPTGKIAWNKDANDKLSFTMKREFDKQKEELDLLEQLRTIIETRLKMSLPEQLAPVLADGVVLCHLANHVRPRSVASVHVPSPAQPKLTMARCRRNVDNFLEACRRIGVEEEVVCSPEDILGFLAQPEQRDSSILPLARTVCELLSHATPRSPKDNQSEQFLFQEEYEEYYRRDVAENSVEVNYYQRRYADDRVVSNFNTDQSQYTIDEAEEYQLNYENNNTDLQQNAHYSPVYNDGVRTRGPYYHKNKIQFVTPFCKGDGILKSDSFDIYDTDEVDFPIDVRQEETQRYDRSKMNLDIQNNLNRDLTIETEAMKKERLLFTCLCLGTFFVSALLLFMYPL